MIRTVQKQGELVTFDDSGRTNLQALEVLKTLPDPSPFAQDLIAQAPRLSEKQWCWVHYLCYTAHQRSVAKKLEMQRSVAKKLEMQLPRLFAVLSTVELERPSITLGALGVNVVCKLTKKRNSVAIVVNGVYLARIDVGGAVALVTPEPLCQKTRATLVLMELDPVGIATLNGRVTGCCCFCARRLETKESVTAGYGPVCAEKWGLPWGEVAPESLLDGIRSKMERLFPQVG